MGEDAIDVLGAHRRCSRVYDFANGDFFAVHADGHRIAPSSDWAALKAHASRGRSQGSGRLLGLLYVPEIHMSVPPVKIARRHRHAGQSLAKPARRTVRQI